MIEQHHIHNVVVDLDEDVYLLDKMSVCQLWVAQSLSLRNILFDVYRKMDEVGVLKVSNSPGNVCWLLEWLLSISWGSYFFICCIWKLHILPKISGQCFGIGGGLVWEYQ